MQLEDFEPIDPPETDLFDDPFKPAVKLQHRVIVPYELSPSPMRETKMNEYNVRLSNGNILTGFGYTPADMPTALEAIGHDRDEISSIQFVARNSPAASGKSPYVELLAA